MGNNCLKCFQTSEDQSTVASPTLAAQAQTLSCTTNVVVGINANERINIYTERRRETDELLLSSRSPLKPANSCDTKRSSFKKSIVLLNGNATTMSSDIITNVVKESIEVSEKKLNHLFDIYKDPDEPDMILAEGIERLCVDLNYQPEEFPILVLAWCFDASQMCRFTKYEFIEGLHKLRADSISMLRSRLEQTVEKLKLDREMFKQLYRFTFRFGLEPDQRILSLDMAISLWKLVFTIHTPDLFAKWIDFLEKHPSIRGIQKDTWNMYHNFSEQCDIENYDDTEAWPSLFDDFVDYEKSRALENNIKAATTSDDIAIDDDKNNNDDPLQIHIKLGEPHHAL